jgi:alkanesulfonate monooxygenase SsuD/methylene tetrahydromethanopterin reductase-like flavin-dependent oxidoreductase (luciferase family)
MPEIFDRVMVCMTEDAEEVYATVRPAIAAYTAVGVYRLAREWLGRGDVLRESWDACAAGDRKAAAAKVPDSVADELVVHGSVDACRAHLERFVNAGATPLLAFLRADYDLDTAIEELGPGSC